MTRKAIIISSDDTEIPGAWVDAALHKEFLLSSFGGAWAEREIEILRWPRLAVVQQALRAAQDVGYAFIAFSGHGEHVRGKTLDETRLWLNDDEVISVVELNPRNKRHVVVVDACRTVRYIAEGLEKVGRALFSNAARLPDPVACRVLFDAEVSDAEEGRVVMYSCQENQTAGEHPQKGGYFTQALIQSSEFWSVTSQRNRTVVRQGAVFRLNEAFEIAKNETYRVAAPQLPVWYPGRRQKHFPYGVVARDDREVLFG